MSHQQHNDWRAQHPKYVNPKVENPKAVQVDGGHEEADNYDIGGTDYTDDEEPMSSAYEEIPKDVWNAMTKRQRKHWRQKK